MSKVYLRYKTALSRFLETHSWFVDTLDLVYSPDLEYIPFDISYCKTNHPYRISFYNRQFGNLLLLNWWKKLCMSHFSGWRYKALREVNESHKNIFSIYNENILHHTSDNYNLMLE